MKNKFFFLSLGLLLIAAGIIASHTVKFKNTSANVPKKKETRDLLVGEKKLSVEIARTDAEMRQGLSDRTSLPQNGGMLFDFGQDSSIIPSFLMKDMNFALDFIWIKNNFVIGITSNVEPPDKDEKSDTKNLILYTPPSPIDKVLEVNSGWAEKNRIAVGDAVEVK